MSSIPSKWYSTQELADLFGISHWCIRRMITQQRLSAVRVGRSLRISEESVQAMMAEMAYVPTGTPRVVLSRPRRATKRRVPAKGGVSA